MESLKKLRIKNNKSVDEISKLLNISVQAYYKYENGKNEPNIENLIKLADYYHVTIDELIGRPLSLINKASLSEREQKIIEQVLEMSEDQQKLIELFLKTLNKNI